MTIGLNFNKLNCWGKLRADPAHWTSAFHVCGGEKQSPIDIVPHAATPQSFMPIFMANYDTTEKKLHIINNGHTVLVKLPKDYPDYRIPSIKDGGLTHQYQFGQLHFHWGSDEKRGSEHTVNSKT